MKLWQALVLFFAAFGQANLTCVQWLFISLYGSFICHFGPKILSAGDSALVKEVESGIKEVAETATSVVKEGASDVGALVKFELTHNAVAVAFEFGEDSQKGKQLLIDDVKVVFGFAKEAGNLAYSLYNIVNPVRWAKVSLCEFDAAQRVYRAAESKRRRRKRGTLDNEAARQAVYGCVLQSLAKPPLFNITDKNEKVGKTIADVASFFIPTEIPGAAAGEAAETFSLAIPGVEDSPAILKNGEKGLEPFASKAEAESVQEHLEDKDWLRKNCAVVNPESSKVAVSSDLSGVARLRRRAVGGQGIGCTLPSVASDAASKELIDGGATSAMDTEEDIVDDEGFMTDSDDERDAYMEEKTLELDKITEEDLVPPPALEMRALTDVAGILSDLETEDVAMISWSDKVKATRNGMFTDAKGVFENPEDPLFKKLGIHSRSGQTRKVLAFNALNKAEPAIQAYRDFAKVVATDINELATKITTLSDLPAAELATKYRPTLNFYYESAEDAVKLPKEGVTHVDDNVFFLGASDEEGLVVYNSKTEKSSRLPVAKEGWYIMKGYYWRGLSTTADKAVTYHGVWGATKARLSLIGSFFHIEDIGGEAPDLFA